MLLLLVFPGFHFLNRCVVDHHERQLLMLLLLLLLGWTAAVFAVVVVMSGRWLVASILRVDLLLLLVPFHSH